jgi:hypothetical protein
MSLKQKSYLIGGIFFGGFFIGLIGAYGLESRVIGAIGLVMMVAACILTPLWIRCPNCGEWLGNYPGGYCKYCGEKIDWDKKNS